MFIAHLRAVDLRSPGEGHLEISFAKFLVCQRAVYTLSGPTAVLRTASRVVSDDDNDNDNDDDDEDVHHVGDSSRFRGRRFLLENNTA